MHSWRALPALVLLASSLAGAQAPDEARLPWLRVSLVGGAALRGLQFAATTVSDERPTSVGGVSPTSLALNTAWFPLDALGVELDGSFSAFVACQPCTADPQSKTPLQGFSLAGGPVGRWAPVPWLRLEGSVGYGVLSEPFVRQGVAASATPFAAAFLAHGVTGKVSAGVAFGALEATAWGRATLPLGGNLEGMGLVVSDVYAYEAGLRVGWAVLDLDTLRVVPLARVAARGSRVWRSELTAFALDFGAGVEVSLVPPRPPRPLPVPPTAFLVTVTLPDGRPASGAVVRVDGAEVGTTDGGGELRAAVASGAHEVTASLPGFTDAATSGTAVEREEVPLRLALTPLTGPGTILGLAQTEDGKPVADVTVTAPGGLKVTTDGAGAFTLPKVGPGIVAVQLSAPGFLKKEELVQVPPAGEAKVTVTLVPSTEPLKAVLRGSIRSTTGRAVNAAVRIAGSKVKVKVGADGRFEVQLDAGTYSLTISAPGHVTQTKSVTLAAGDQAIFQVDLQPGG